MTMSQNQNSADFVPYDETAKRALICDSDAAAQKFLAAALTSLGFRPDAVTTIDDLVESVKYNQYDVIVVSEGFSVNPKGENDAIGFFQDLPIGVRRKILIILYGSSFNTLDNTVAYGLGVNVVINTRDMQSFSAIAGKAYAENERFFRTINQIYNMAGKN